MRRYSGMGGRRFMEGLEGVDDMEARRRGAGRSFKNILDGGL